MGSAKRGRKAQPKDGRAKRIAELEREAQRLQRKLEQAEMVIEIQKTSPRYWAPRPPQYMGGEELEDTARGSGA